MRKAVVILLFTLLIFTSNAGAQILSPVFHLEGTLGSDTKAIFAGKTSIEGTFQGYQLDYYPYNLFIEDISVFPLLGTSTLSDIESVKIIDIDSLGLDVLLEFDNIDDLEGVTFSNVDIIAEEGPFLLGTTQGDLSIKDDASYAITSIINLDIEEVGYIQFLVALTRSMLDTQFSGESAYLVSNSNNSNILIKDSSGNRVWSSSSTNYIFYIQDEDFTIQQDSSLYLFPLISNEAYETAKITIYPSDTHNNNVLSLLDELSEVASEYVDISEISDSIQSYESLISAASSVVNGGMILIDSEDTFTVDGSSQTFVKIGFARGSKFDVSISKETNTSVINGDFKLIFLGDHLYTSQASESKDGVSFPYIILIIWIVAIVLFILFRFYLHLIRPILIKKEIDETNDEKIKKYALIFHIVALVIVFILLDREISFQFGMSAIDAMFGQGFTLVLLGFVVVELIMWVLGYFALAFPMRIISNSILRIIGIGKAGKGIGKGIGAFGIWIFCAFFVKLIINILFLIINPNSLFPMG